MTVPASSRAFVSLVGAGPGDAGLLTLRGREALEQAEDGNVNAVSDARSESYHTVWFELHEDLLRLTGRQREE